ncbi:MAG: SNF2-related protein [Mucilaginibacter sp.]
MKPAVVINIDQDKSAFILTGEVKQLLNNRRAKFYFTDNLRFQANDDVINVFYEIDEQERTLTTLKDALNKYGFETVNGDTILEVLKQYISEEENFKLFSKQAKGIWNNEIDPVQFKFFKESLQKNLTNRKLYDMQLLAAYHLAFSMNACNFSVPGAGKTSVVYGAYSFFKSLQENDPRHVDKLFIIGPLSSFGPWEDEYKECFGVKVNSKRLSGGVSKDDREGHLLSILDPNETPELTLLSYQSVAFNLENIILYLKKNKVMVVLDEAHKIKNADGGIWAQSVLTIAKYCVSRVVLTGTPIPNGFEDIFNLYNFIWPDKDIIKFHLFQLKDMTANRFDPRVKQLVENISPFFIRIRKSDLNLPAATEHKPIIVKMGEVQRGIYDFIENSYIDYFKEQNTGNKDLASTLSKARFIRLLQTATNPELLKSPIEKYYSEEGITSDLFIDDSEILSNILNYSEKEVPAKFIAVKDIVKQIIHSGQKVIIWGTFIHTVKGLQSFLFENGITSKLLIGEIPVETDTQPEMFETRESIIRDFHDPNSNFKVLIANPFAVAESISLHKVCHNAIYLERNFNASNFLQSKDRIHRVGLKPDDPTNYYYILSERSIDETVHTRLIEKERRMLDIIENQPIPLINMNMDYEVDLSDDIKALIRDYVQRTS